MEPIQLILSTGQPQIDHAIRGIVSLFEVVFPGRIRSYYLVGSYSVGSATSLSDIDIRIIFKDDFGPGEEEQMHRVRYVCRLLCPIAIDCPPLSEKRLFHDEAWLHEPLGIKSYGRLLYGADIQDQFSEPAFSAYLRNVTTVPVTQFARIRRQEKVSYPLAYPDPMGEFYGYDDRIGPVWAKVPSTKTLVHMIGFAATCLLAFRAGQMVTQKSDWLKLYREKINDEWTHLLETLYVQCKEVWSYTIPDNEAERHQLREICAEVLAFENYYLSCYHRYLLHELQSGQHARRQFAYDRLKEIEFPDDELKADVITGDLDS